MGSAALAAPLLCPPDSNQALQEDLVPFFPRISLLCSEPPLLTSPVSRNSGGIPGPKTLIRGKRDILE